MGQGEGLFRRLDVRWSFAFRVFFPASQPVEQRHKRIGVPRMFFPAPWLSAALDLRQSYREAPGRPSGGFGAASSSEPYSLRRASQMCAHKKLRHVAPLRRMQGVIFRGADKLPEWSAESAHSNRGPFLQSHQYRRRDIRFIERFRICQ